MYQNRSDRYLMVFCINHTANVSYDFIQIVLSWKISNENVFLVTSIKMRMPLANRFPSGLLTGLISSIFINKHHSDNCYVTCLLQENTCLVWVPIATIQILTGLYYWCYQGNSKSPITCSIAQSCGRFSLWYHFPLNKNLW